MMCFGDLGRFVSASPPLLQTFFWRCENEVETWINSTGWLDFGCSCDLGLRGLSTLLVTARLNAPKLFGALRKGRLDSPLLPPPPILWPNEARAF